MGNVTVKGREVTDMMVKSKVDISTLLYTMPTEDNVEGEQDQEHRT